MVFMSSLHFILSCAEHGSKFYHINDLNVTIDQCPTLQDAGLQRSPTSLNADSSSIRTLSLLVN